MGCLGDVYDRHAATSPGQNLREIGNRLRRKDPGRGYEQVHTQNLGAHRDACRSSRVPKVNNRVWEAEGL